MHLKCLLTSYKQVLFNTTIVLQTDSYHRYFSSRRDTMFTLVPYTLKYVTIYNMIPPHI